MKNIIIFGSKYGSTKRYARELAERTSIECVDYREVKDIKDYDNIIYLGGLYAGATRGLNKIMRKVSSNQGLIIVTVGIGDAYSEETKKKLDTSLNRQYGNLLDNARLFHLRGAIDYAKLNPFERLGMKMLYKMMAKKSEEDRSADANAIMSTYGGSHDFVDFTKLDEIITAIEDMNR